MSGFGVTPFKSKCKGFSLHSPSSAHVRQSHRDKSITEEVDTNFSAASTDHKALWAQNCLVWEEQPSTVSSHFLSSGRKLIFLLLQCCHYRCQSAHKTPSSAQQVQPPAHWKLLKARLENSFTNTLSWLTVLCAIIHGEHSSQSTSIERCTHLQTVGGGHHQCPRTICTHTHTHTSLNLHLSLALYLSAALRSSSTS